MDADPAPHLFEREGREREDVGRRRRINQRTPSRARSGVTTAGTAATSRDKYYNGDKDYDPSPSPLFAAPDLSTRANVRRHGSIGMGGKGM